MSIQAVPSLLQILNANLCKKLIGPGGVNVLPLDIADLSDRCPVILLQNLEVGFVSGEVALALSIAFHTQELYSRAGTIHINTDLSNVREDVCRPRGRDGRLFSAGFALFKQESDVDVTLIFQCVLPVLTD